MVNILDVAHDTVRSLSISKARSALTILGIIVGIASVITLVSLGDAVKQSITDEITSLGTNLISVSFSGSTYSLTDEDVTTLENLSFVGEVAPVVSGSYDIVYGTTSGSYTVMGVTPGYADVMGVTIEEGSFITEFINNQKAHDVVLGSSVATALFDTVDPVGQTVNINGVPYYVIGVAEASSSSLSTSDDSVFIPMTTAQKTLIGDSITSVRLTVNNISTSDTDNTTVMDADESLIKSAIAANHGIDLTVSTNENVIQATSSSSLLSTVSTITSMLTAFLAAIAGISLLVGGIGVMNMMLTSVTERTREIGLRKAVGATPGAITAQFLAEAITLTVIGGLLGVLVGWGASSLLTRLAGIDSVISASTVLLAVGVCAAIGIIFGIIPAKRAGKLDPIDALRYQ
jgi:putative ABC transport system permease protein